MVETKYFDLLKDMIEDKFANGKLTLSSISFIIGLIRKVAQCERTEYSSKFVELIQGVLGLIETQLPGDSAQDRGQS